MGIKTIQNFFLNAMGLKKVKFPAFQLPGLKFTRNVLIHEDAIIATRVFPSPKGGAPFRVHKATSPKSPRKYLFDAKKVTQWESFYRHSPQFLNTDRDDVRMHEAHEFCWSDTFIRAAAKSSSSRKCAMMREFTRLKKVAAQQPEPMTGVEMTNQWTAQTVAVYPNEEVEHPTLDTDLEMMDVDSTTPASPRQTYNVCPPQESYIQQNPFCWEAQKVNESPLEPAPETPNRLVCMATPDLTPDHSDQSSFVDSMVSTEPAWSHFGSTYSSPITEDESSSAYVKHSPGYVQPSIENVQSSSEQAEQFLESLAADIFPLASKMHTPSSPQTPCKPGKLATPRHALRHDRVPRLGYSPHKRSYRKSRSPSIEADRQPSELDLSSSSLSNSESIEPKSSPVANDIPQPTPTPSSRSHAASIVHAACLAAKNRHRQRQADKTTTPKQAARRDIPGLGRSPLHSGSDDVSKPSPRKLKLKLRLKPRSMPDSSVAVAGASLDMGFSSLSVSATSVEQASSPETNDVMPQAPLPSSFDATSMVQAASLAAKNPLRPKGKIIKPKKAAQDNIPGHGRRSDRVSRSSSRKVAGRSSKVDLASLSLPDSSSVAEAGQSLDMGLSSLSLSGPSSVEQASSPGANEIMPRARESAPSPEMHHVAMLATTPLPSQAESQTTDLSPTNLQLPHIHHPTPLQACSAVVAGQPSAEDLSDFLSGLAVEDVASSSHLPRSRESAPSPEMHHVAMSATIPEAPQTESQATDFLPNNVHASPPEHSSPMYCMEMSDDLSMVGVLYPPNTRIEEVDNIAQLWEHGVNAKVKATPKQPRLRFSVKLNQKREAEFKNVLAHDFAIFEMLIGYQLQTGRKPLDMLNALASEVIGDPGALGQKWMTDYPRIDRMATTGGFDSHMHGSYYDPNTLTAHKNNMGNPKEIFDKLLGQIQNGQQWIFDDVLNAWSWESEENMEALYRIISRAGWVLVDQMQGKWQQIAYLKVETDLSKQRVDVQKLIAEEPRTLNHIWQKLP